MKRIKDMDEMIRQSFVTIPAPEFEPDNEVTVMTIIAPGWSKHAVMEVLCWKLEIRDAD